MRKILLRAAMVVAVSVVWNAGLGEAENLAVCLGGELQELEAGSTLKLALKSTLEVLEDLERLEIIRTAAEKDSDEGDEGDEEEEKDEKPAGERVFSRAGGAAKGYRLALSAVAATVDAGATYKIVSAVKGGKAEEVSFTLHDVEVPPCGEGPAKAADLERLEKLVETMTESKFAPDTKSLQEFAENAVVTIDAATGEITPGSRIKIRRGHYAVINVRNGIILDIQHAQSYSEGGSLFEGSPAPAKATGRLGRGHSVGRIVGSAAGTEGFTAELLAALRLTSQRREELSALSTRALLGTPEVAAAPESVQRVVEGEVGQRSAWVRAGLRESVFTVTVLAAKRNGSAIDVTKTDPLTLQSLTTEYTLTLNAQKWGVGTMAGFVFADTDERDYLYVNNPDGETKTIQTAADSSATPFPSFFVNFWRWSKPQWAISLGVALDSAENRALYSIGYSYLFSRHGQITLGAALVPERNLPSGFSAGSSVPLSDTTLQSLKDEYHVRPIVAIGWTFGGRGASDSAAETEPVKK